MWTVELIGIVVAAAVLRLTAEAAERSRWARTLLTLGVLMTVFVALAAGLIGWYRGAHTMAISGLLGGCGIALAWWRHYRAMLTRWLRIDPNSMLDATGLAAIQGAIGILLGLSLAAREVPPLAISREQLVAQGVAEVLLAAVLVGFPFSRSLGDTCRRLGLRWLSAREAVWALVFTGILFLVSSSVGWVASLVQPDVVARIEERFVPLASEFGSPVGALLLGVISGTGEELLFRGAMQPRYGLLLTTMLFTLLHIQYELSVVTLGVAGLALVLGVERRLFGTTACILTHATYNTIVLLLQASAG